MKKVRVYLKSGNVVKFRCKGVRVTSGGGQISSYTFTDMPSWVPTFSLSDIEGIIYR